MDKFTLQIEFLHIHGYPVESHYVSTNDGYILNLHRLPVGKRVKSNGKIAYFAHGMYTTSMMWLILGPDKSLRK